MRQLSNRYLTPGPLVPPFCARVPTMALRSTPRAVTVNEVLFAGRNSDTGMVAPAMALAVFNHTISKDDCAVMPWAVLPNRKVEFDRINVPGAVAVILGGAVAVCR